MLRSVPMVILSVLSACAGVRDQDEDGLSEAEELELGTDPERADSDQDGLPDGAEQNKGTDPLVSDTDGDLLLDGDEGGADADPLNADTDGDGYLDGWEVNEGKDPADATSVIYRGGWPYNPNKDAYGAPTLADASDDDGNPLARFQLLDQFGDMVDLYDFADQGQYMLLDISAIWCGPCNGYAEWLSSERSSEYDRYWGHVKEAVVNGDLRWVTVLGEDARGRTVDLEDLEAWYETYPEPSIPVLSDADGAVVDVYLAGGWPTIYFIGPDLVIEEDPQASSDPDRFYRALYAAEDFFAELYGD